MRLSQQSQHRDAVWSKLPNLEVAERRAAPTHALSERFGQQFRVIKPCWRYTVELSEQMLPGEGVSVQPYPFTGCAVGTCHLLYPLMPMRFLRSARESCTSSGAASARSISASALFGAAFSSP